jgi:hypothetical protein
MHVTLQGVGLAAHVYRHVNMYTTCATYYANMSLAVGCVVVEIYMGGLKIFQNFKISKKFTKSKSKNFLSNFGLICSGEINIDPKTPLWGTKIDFSQFSNFYNFLKI